MFIFMILFRAITTVRCFIKSERLFINNIEYTLEDILEAEEAMEISIYQRTLSEL